jgi:glutathione S-transferase
MLKLHSLERSRAIRVLWLLEELGVEYELIRYKRDPAGRAPPELKEIHPLGKSPVLVDGDLVLAESSAILRYINDRYADGRFAPSPGSQLAAVHDSWLDFAEGSAMLPLAFSLMSRRIEGVPETMTRLFGPQLETALRYIEAGVTPGPFLLGAKPMLADMQMIYLLQVANTAGVLEGHPSLANYLSRMLAQPALQRAISKGENG